MRIFISAFTSKATNEDEKRSEAQRNEANMQQLFSDLTTLGVKSIDKVIGKYKGTIENSFAISLGDVFILDVYNLARKYEQESILIVMIGGESFLKFTDSNDLVRIGMASYSDNQPESEDYSFFPNSGMFMTILK